MFHSDSVSSREFETSPSRCTNTYNDLAVTKTFHRTVSAQEQWHARSAEAFVRSWLRDNLISKTVRNADGTLKEQIEFVWPCIQASIAAGFNNVEEDVDVAELVDIAFEAAATGDEF